MMLFTKADEKALQNNYLKGSDMSQEVIVKIFNPYGSWTWYIMNQDPNDPDYLWCIVRGNETEVGSASKSELENTRIKMHGCQLPLERDKCFDPAPAKEIYDKLLAGRHV